MHQVRRKIMIQGTVFIRNERRLLIIFVSTIGNLLGDFNA